jgi:hypothetical protein
MCSNPDPMMTDTTRARATLLKHSKVQNLILQPLICGNNVYTQLSMHSVAAKLPEVASPGRQLSSQHNWLDASYLHAQDSCGRHPSNYDVPCVEALLTAVLSHHHVHARRTLN